MIETKYFTKKSYVTTADVTPYFKDMKVDKGSWKDVVMSIVRSEYKIRSLKNPTYPLTFVDLIDYDKKTQIANIGVKNPEYIFPQAKDFLKERDFKVFFSFLLYLLSISLDDKIIEKIDISKEKCLIELIMFYVGQSGTIMSKGWDKRYEFYSSVTISETMKRISVEKNLNHH